MRLLLQSLGILLWIEEFSGRRSSICLLVIEQGLLLVILGQKPFYRHEDIVNSNGPPWFLMISKKTHKSMQRRPTELLCFKDLYKILWGWEASIIMAPMILYWSWFLMIKERKGLGGLYYSGSDEPYWFWFLTINKKTLWTVQRRRADLLCFFYAVGLRGLYSGSNDKNSSTGLNVCLWKR